MAPSSRHSTQSQQATGYPSHATHNGAVARPASVQSQASTARARPAPFTPGVPAGRTSRQGRENLGLSAKQVDKLSETIANVRRKAVEAVTEIEASPATSSDGLFSRRSVTQDLNGQAKPDNQRNRHGATQNERISAMRYRQIITGSDAEYDNENDLNRYTEYRADSPHQQLGESDAKAACGDPAVLEALLIEELLCALMGYEGQLIRYAQDYSPDDALDRLKGVTYVLVGEVDDALAEVVEKMLPLATSFAATEAFVGLHGRHEYGLTSHALCSAMREYKKDYLTLVAQLEDHFESSSTFSLQRFYYLSQPMMHKFDVLCRLIRDLTYTPVEQDNMAESSDSDEDEDNHDEDEEFGGGAALKAVIGTMDKTKKRSGWAAGGLVKGGEILALITERLERTEGDPQAQAIYSHLLLKASQPYARIMQRWMETGHLVDPHGEVVIREAKQLNSAVLDQDYVDEYWETKYALRDTTNTAPGGTTAPGVAGGNPADIDSIGVPEKVNYRDDLQNAEKRSDKRIRGLGGGAIVPSYLQPWKTKIFMAGKYLNVIRECTSDGTQSPSSSDGSIVPSAISVSQQDIDMQSSDFHERVDIAYDSANRALLNMLITEQELYQRLRSLKHHFFFDQGDSFTHFLDLASHELNKKVKHVSLSKLQSLLDLAIRNPSSASGADPFNEDVKVVMATSALIDWLTKIINVNDGTGVSGDAGNAEQHSLAEGGVVDEGKKPGKTEDKPSIRGIEALSLDYNVKFPLSLVISRKAILRYQLLFRHLLGLKHLEQLLTGSWLEHSKTPVWRINSRHTAVERWKNRVITLRARMLGWVQQMFAFCVSEVLEVKWRLLMTRLDNIATVDQLLRHHMDFLDTSLKECMLTNSKLLRLHSKLATTCMLFASHAPKLALAAGKLNSAVQQAASGIDDRVGDTLKESDNFLQKFELNFYRHQKTHYDTVTYHSLNDTVALRSLTIRLQHAIPFDDGFLA